MNENTSIEKPLPGRWFLVWWVVVNTITADLIIFVGAVFFAGLAIVGIDGANQQLALPLEFSPPLLNAAGINQWPLLWQRISWPLIPVLATFSLPIADLIDTLLAIAAFILFFLPGMVLVGVGQWAIIWRYISRSWLWVLAGVAAGFIGLFLAWVILVTGIATVDVYSISLMAALMCQAVVGILQGLIFAQQGIRAGWIWLPTANIIGTLGTYFFGRWIENHITLYLDTAVDYMVYSLIGAPFAVVTGLTVWWLLRTGRK
jgi:hypothetical protein